MQSGLACQTPIVIDVVIAVDGVIEQGDALNDKLAVVGDAAADVPMMKLREQVVFNVERDVHRLKYCAFPPIFSERDLSNVTIAETKLEVPMKVFPSQIKQSIEFLKVITRKETIQVAILQIKNALFRNSHKIHLIS